MMSSQKVTQPAVEQSTKAKNSHLQVKSMKNINKYKKHLAPIIGMIIHHIEESHKKHNEIACPQIYNLKQCIKRCKEKRRIATKDEISLLHQLIVFTPKHLQKQSGNERNKKMDNLIFLTEKKNGILKARACTNGRF